MTKSKFVTFADMRQAFGFSQNDWAIILGMSRASWNYIETRRRRPTSKQLKSIEPYAHLMNFLENTEPDASVVDLEQQKIEATIFLRREYALLKERLRAAREELTRLQDVHFTSVLLASRIGQHLNDSTFLPPRTMELLHSRQMKLMKSSSPKVQAALQLKIVGLEAKVNWLQAQQGGAERETE